MTEVDENGKSVFGDGLKTASGISARNRFENESEMFSYSIIFDKEF